MALNLLNTPQSYPWLTSILFHVLLLVSIIGTIHFSKQQFHIDSPDVPTMHTYMYANNFNNSASSVKPLMINSTLSLKLAAPHQTTSISSRLAKQVTQTASRGKKTSALITQLHNAIQNQQRYPLPALQMEREGTVAVTFTLNTDGTINNLIVARSSGTNSLDEAALAAVMDAVPFAQVSRYIQSPQTYTLDIVFQLA